MSIIDRELKERREVIDQFWTYNGSETTPVCATANRTAEKIFASSNSNSGQNIIHYFEKSDKQERAFAKPTNQVFPSCKFFFYF